MADNDENVKATFDLDTKDALESVFKLGKAIKGVGGSDSTGELIEGLMKLGAYAGIAAAAFFALKAVVEAAFEAENIRSINTQFEILSKNAGVAGDALHSSLTQAANGLIDDTELLKGANKALVEMGGNAAGIGKTLELATKITNTFGGELSANWEQINTAIASGQTRQLRSLGLMINSDKAVKDYARSLGVAENSLSQAGKQQAIMNAVLETGEQRFKGVDGTTRELHNTWQQFKVAMVEIGEVITMVLDRLFGKAVKQAVTTLSVLAHEVKINLKSAFGEGREAAEAEIEKLRIRSQTLSEQVQGHFRTPIAFFNKEKAIQELEEITKAIAAKRAEMEKNQPKDAKGSGAAEQDRLEKDVLLKNETKFQADKLKLKQEADQSSLAYGVSEQQFEVIRNDQRLNLINERNVKEMEILNNKELNETQKAQILEQLYATYYSKIQEFDNQTASVRLKNLQMYDLQSKNVMDGIANAQRTQSLAMGKDVNNFGKTGERVMNSYQTHAVDAFHAVGAGQADVGEAMRDVAFGVIADEADARGKYMIAGSLFPFNPLGLAGGAALLALAGLLRSKSSSAKGVGGGGGGGGGGGSATPSLGIDSTTPDQVAKNEAPKKSVTISVSGHYFETEQTKTRLVEMVREATDATDFKYVQVGQS